GVEGLEDRTVPTTFFVSNTNDSGAGSLRQAVLDANANAGADVIQFAQPFFSAPQTITLTSGELRITDALTIQGTGAALLAVTGNHSRRVFDVDAGKAATSLAGQISGLTVTGGTVGDGGGFFPGGGGIFNAENLVLTNSAVSGNTASISSFGGGGGIFN